MRPAPNLSRGQTKVRVFLCSDESSDSSTGSEEKAGSSREGACAVLGSSGGGGGGSAGGGSVGRGHRVRGTGSVAAYICHMHTAELVYNGSV
jgi:hypothetical protein